MGIYEGYLVDIWRYLGDILGISWGYLRDILGIYLGSLGSAGCSGDVWGISGEFLGKSGEFWGISSGHR